MAYIDEKKLLKAGDSVGLSRAQMKALWQALQTEKSPFRWPLLYLGALIVGLPVFWFYDPIKAPLPALLVASGAMSLFFGFGLYFIYQKHWITPGGVFAFLSVVLMPFTLYALRMELKLSCPSWMMEMVTALFGILCLYLTRFTPLLLLINALAVGIVLDLYPLPEHMGVLWVGMGLGFIALAKIIPSGSFWNYLFGAPLFNIGCAMELLPSEWGWGIFCGIQILLLLSSSYFHSIVFLGVAALGIMSYVFHLSQLFADNSWFSYLIITMGLLIVLGTVYLWPRKK